jgi:hypothetical protein
VRVTSCFWRTSPISWPLTGLPSTTVAGQPDQSTPGHLSAVRARHHPPGRQRQHVQGHLRRSRIDGAAGPPGPHPLRGLPQRRPPPP